MTKMTVLEVQHRLRRRLLEIRAMYRFLDNPRFEDALEAALPEHLAKLDTILKSDDAKALRLWVKATLNQPLHLKGIRELKDIARDKMIPKYSRLSRDQLIRALEKHNAASMGECQQSSDGGSPPSAPSGNP
jgi:hypothetical protein